MRRFPVFRAKQSFGVNLIKLVTIKLQLAVASSVGTVVAPHRWPVGGCCAPWYVGQCRRVSGHGCRKYRRVLLPVRLQTAIGTELEKLQKGECGSECPPQPGVAKCGVPADVKGAHVSRSWKNQYSLNTGILFSSALS